MGHRVKKTISLHLPESLLKRLNIFSLKERRNRNTCIHSAIENTIEAKEKKELLALIKTGKYNHKFKHGEFFKVVQLLKKPEKLTEEELTKIQDILIKVGVPMEQYPLARIYR